LTRDIRCLSREQKQHGVRNLFGFGEPSHRNLIEIISSSSFENEPIILVFTAPGETALTLMPLGASSFARALTNTFCAPFVMLYKTSHDAPVSPQMELTATIAPDFFLIIAGSRFLVNRNGLETWSCTMS
jgi:hypothetical protein